MMVTVVLKNSMLGLPIFFPNIFPDRSPLVTIADVDFATAIRYIIARENSWSMIYMRKQLMRFVMVCLFLMAITLGTVTAATTDSMDSNAITSSATGELLVTPDRAEISLSVQTQNADVKAAQSENAKIMNDVMNALTSSGIPKDQLKTTGYYIYPVYEDNSNNLFSKKVKTYQVTNTLVITLKDISKAGDVIDLAVANGANQVNYISFMLAPETEQSYRSVALTKAVQQTRADANAASAALGVNITGVKEAVIGSSLPPVVYDTTRSLKMSGGAGPAMPTPITPGDVKVSASVTVSYLFL